MANRGWIRLCRSIQDNWMWEETPFSKGQAWIDLLLLANHKDEKFAYKDTVVTGQRGTVYRSYLFLADRWGWSRDKVRRFMSQLESDGMVTTNATRHNTTITIVNYGKYQDFTTTNDTTNRQQTDNRPTTDRQHTAIYNNVNNVNNVNNEDVDISFEPQPLPEIGDTSVIKEAWNSSEVTQKIRSIPPLSRRDDNTRLCIGHDFGLFMDTIKSLDKQAFFVQQKEKGRLLTYDWFVDPNNYQKVVEGNYENTYKEEKSGTFWD